MFSKYKEFADSLRSIMRDREIKSHSVTEKGGVTKDTDSSGEKLSSISDELEAKFDELFGPFDNDD